MTRGFWFSVAWGVVALGACGGKAEPAPSPAVADVVAPPAPGPAEPYVRFREGEQAVTRAQIGAPVIIELGGMPRGATVELRAVMRAGEQPYTSWGTFVADARGVVDTQVQAPVAGTWSEADADGPFWSMSKVSSAPSDLDRFNVRVTATVEGRVLASATLVRYHAVETVQRKVLSDGVRGVYFAPPAGEPTRGALLLLGAGGPGSTEAEPLAAWWATRGYAALALSYFGEGDLPVWRQEIPLETFGKALAWLAARPEIAGKKIVVHGAGRSGEAALLVGATFPDVRGVIAESPSGVAWGAPVASGEKPTWTLAAQPVPYVPRAAVEPEVSTGSDGEPIVRYARVFSASVAGAPAATVEGATIRAERTTGPVLLLAGAEDGFWPACDLAKRAYDRLTSSAHAASNVDTSLCYPDAGHVLGLPGMPTTDLSVVFDVTRREWLALGGTPRGTAKAQRDVYRRVTRFVEDVTR